MKNELLALSFAAALLAPVFADDHKSDAVLEEEESVAQLLATSEANAAAPVKEALWPAFFAFSEWPQTPDLIGLRITLPYSSRQESVTGIDLGLWGVSKDFEGLQLNLLRSNVRDTFGGIQFSLYNSVNRGDLFGIQLGLFNESNSFRGLQVGLVNATGDAQGFQVGVVNRAETLYGFQVGLINVIRDAEIPVFPVLNIGF